MVDLAIQLVNYKTKQYLQDFLPYLLKDLEKASFSFSINILDNNSGDDLSDLQDKYKKFKQISFLSSPKNLGFGAGHNFLAKKVQAKYLLILNVDLKFIEPNTIQRLMNNIEIREEIKVVGPMLITPKDTIQWCDHGDSNFPYSLPCKNKHTILSKVAWVSGAILLIDKPSFDKVGGFDENFFLFAEEVDLCYQISKKGGKIFYDPEIKVFHYRGVVAHPGRFVKCSNNYFIDKNFRNKPYYWVLKIGNYLMPYFLIPDF